MIQKYSTKPHYITAVQYTGTNISEIEHMMQMYWPIGTDKAYLDERSVRELSSDLIRKHKDKGIEVNRFDRYLHIGFNKNTSIDVIKTDYVVFDEIANKFYVYDEQTFNSKFDKV